MHDHQYMRQKILYYWEDLSTYTLLILYLTLSGLRLVSGHVAPPSPPESVAFDVLGRSVRMRFINMLHISPRVARMITTYEINTTDK